jgi:hypothetical protein
MRHMTRWWDGMGKAERITAMSLATGALIAIVNSTVWAIASSYMVRQRTLAEIERARHNVLPEGQNDVSEETETGESALADANLAAPSI